MCVCVCVCEGERESVYSVGASVKLWMRAAILSYMVNAGYAKVRANYLVLPELVWIILTTLKHYT